MTVPFEKYHGAGNDFVIVDAEQYVPDRASFAETVCDRKRGIGADGVLFLALEDQYQPPRVVMSLVQPDGSTAAMCGNGARCAAHWATQRIDSDTVMIDTLAGTRRGVVHDDEATVRIGQPSLSPADVPVARDDPLVEEDVHGLTVTAVDAGVPHAVAFVDDVDAVDLERAAPPVRNASVFPEGANVTLAACREDGSLDQRTYERGVEGETAACGTGAVAAAFAARELGLVDADAVTVRPPGGDLDVSFDNRGVATLAGPVVREFADETRIGAPEV